MRTSKTTIIIFLLPSMIFLSLFVIYPMLYNFYISLFKWKVVRIESFTGLDNYFKLLGNTQFHRAFINNVIWILIHVPTTTFLGLLLAVLLKRVKGSYIIKSIIFLGMVIPQIVVGIMLLFMFDSDAGVINGLLRALNGIFTSLGMTELSFPIRSWTAYPDTALPALIIGSIWIWTGFAVVVYSAGLEGIPKDLYDAAEVDGASPLKTFWHITLPMLKPATIVVVTMTLIWVLKIFDIVYIATRGGPGGATNVMAYMMYEQGFVFYKWGIAAAIATIFTVIILAFSIYLVRAMVRR